MEKRLNNSEWAQTVWVWGSRRSHAWFFLQSWLQNVSAHHNWRSFLSILMFGQENGKHIEQFWSHKFVCWVFSGEVVCVGFNDGWNASVHLDSAWASVEPRFTSLKAFGAYLIPEMMEGTVTLPNPAANYCVSMMSCDAAVTREDNEHIHLMHL